MKTLIHRRQNVRERGRATLDDATFTNRFVTRNLRALDTALKTARVSLRRGKSVAIRTHAEFRRMISVKR